MHQHLLFILALLSLVTWPASARSGTEGFELAHAPAPAGNPLKGLVPYAGDRGDRFPHSMEFDYLPLSGLVVGRGAYDWGPLERLLDEIAGRGHHAVFRIYMEYPNREGGIPQYLIDDGVEVHTWRNTNTQPFPPAVVRTPDYEDPRLRRMLRDFIAALGRRYDGDARIGAITAGLLGTWGEWHTYPRGELFASKAVQREVLDAFEAAFEETPVLLRYPAGPGDPVYAANHRRDFGYHDDSFAWATLDTGRPGDEWFFMALLGRAGPPAPDRWKTRPIGGEIRPELWGRIFDPDPGVPEAQDFIRCVEATHASWLMDSGMFDDEVPPGRRARATAMVRRMGYEYFVPSVSIEVGEEGDGLDLGVELTNRGVAPFYRDWPIGFAMLEDDGRLARTFEGKGRLSGLLPGRRRTWRERLDLRGLAAGRYRVLMRVVNPLPGGVPFRFANEAQDRDRDGWLTLGTVAVPADE